MIAYKLVWRPSTTGSPHRLPFANRNMSKSIIRYIVGETVSPAIGASFLYDTIDHALDFVCRQLWLSEDDFSLARLELWESEIEEIVPTPDRVLLPNLITMVTLMQFWSGRYFPDRQTMNTPPGTICAKCVKLTKRVGTASTLLRNRIKSEEAKKWTTDSTTKGSTQDADSQSK